MDILKKELGSSLLKQMEIDSVDGVDMTIHPLGVPYNVVSKEVTERLYKLYPDLDGITAITLQNCNDPDMPREIQSDITIDDPESDIFKRVSATISNNKDYDKIVEQFKLVKVSMTVCKSDDKVDFNDDFVWKMDFERRLI